MRKMIESLIAFALILTPCVAHAQTTDVSSIDQTNILKRLDASNVVPVLKVVTGNHINLVDAEANHYINATATNGLKFDINFHGCEKPKAEKLKDMNCRGLSLVSVWDESTDVMTLAGSIREFLVNNPLANAGFLSDGRLYITRYIIADYGIAQGNLLSEMANFVRVASNFANTMNAATASKE